MRLNDRCIIITGAAGNLGAAVAIELAGHGAQLVCVDRTHDALTALAGRLPASTETLLLPGVDLTRPEDAAAMTKAALDRFGEVYGLVNTIGAFKMGRVATDALDSWDFLFNLNARATLVASAAVLPAMVEAKTGRIVHVAAAAGYKGTAGLAVYSAAKSAVMRIVESIAEEHRADGITANCVLPGTIDTPQNRAAMPNADFSTWVSPASIARVIAFLVSPDAAAVTGGAIPATGLG